MEEASVAGESPDRSKQRESSAEPTSGSAGTVPEPRDPRLAVAAEDERETAGGVDTATRIFSVRDVKTAGEDDTKLREAVAAWVRTGPPAEETEDSGKDAEVPERPEAATEGPEAAEEPQEAPEPPKNADRADTAPEATTEADTENEPEPEDTAPTTNTTDKNTPKPVPEPEDAAKPAAEPEDAAPEDEPKAAAEPEDEPRAAAEPEDATPEDEPKAAAEPEDATPEDNPIAATEPEDAAPEDAPKSAAEPEDAAPEDEPRAAAEPEDAAPEDEPRAAAEPEDATPEDESKAAAEPEDAAPKDAPKSAAEPEDATPEDAKPEDKPKAAAEPEDAAPEDEPKAVSGLAVADGEGDPQGPPAVGDESRTGGAGGDTETATGDGPAPADGEDATGEAEAEAKAEAAVDQPTTMLKAPRPPQVDQPTTTLKLGSKTPESDPERTSRFVALKSDLKPDTKPDAKPEAKPGAKPGTASTTRTTAIPQVGPERTTQLPLPPKPPLDLLAELTNTPPPPETGVRTFVRRVKIWTPLVIVLLIIFAVVQTLRPLPQPTLDLTAKDSYTFDGSKADIPWPADGQAALDVQGIGSFGSSGDQKPVPIASVAKVMTAYIILRDHPLKSGAAGPKIGIDQAAEDQSKAGQESTVDVTAGDTFTQREALESILIASANNVARLLARWDAGSEKAFVAKMNATAKKLGMTNTTYTDPSGLTDSTVSTAVDQVKLAKAAMSSEPSFREVAAMMSYDDYKGVNHGNWNQLVGHNDVVGIKTGTTTSALGNLVFAAKKDVNGETRTIIGAVLRQPASAASDNSILTAALNGGDKLIRAAQGALKSATIYKKGAVVGYVDDGLGGRTPVVATKDVTAVGWSGLKVKLTFQADDVPHTAKAGTKVGALTVGDGSGSAVQVPVALQKDLAEPGFASKLTRIG
ncbi:D-alanyl-D-alanine carboxypeptidase [Streptomyces sp. NPDC002763]|uniref:D-alanyl-D-alanine carboxypeptidase n=1 Tax=Streptomyces sp. NPDC002763 TaxID=3154427 RepID=UPI0033206AF4